MHRENTPELKELCEQSRSCFLQLGSLVGEAGVRGQRGPGAGAEGCGAMDAPRLTNTVTEHTGLS